MPAKTFRDIEEVAAQTVAINLGGKDYVLSPLRLRDHAEVRMHVRSQAMQSFMAALRVMPTAERPLPREEQDQLARILRARITDEEMFEFYDTLEGLQYMIWQSLKHQHKDITLEVVEGMLIEPDQLETLCTAIAELSGLRAEEGEQSTNPPTSPQNGKAISPDSADSTGGK